VKIINKVLIGELKPYYWSIFLILVLIFLTVGFAALIPLPFKIIIDNVLGGELLDTSTHLGKFLSFFTSREVLGFFAVFLYAVSSIGSSVTEYLSNILTKKLSRNLVQGFAQRTFENIEKLDIHYYKDQNIGDYLYRLSYDVSAFGTLFEDGLLPIITNTLYLIVTVAILSFIDTRLTLYALLMLPFLVTGLGIFDRSIDRATIRSERSNSTLFSFIEEALNQLRTIQAFNQEKRQSHIFEQKENDSLSDELSVYGLTFMMNSVIDIILALGYAFIILAGVRAVFSGEISTGLLVVFIFYLDNLANPVISLSSGIATFREQYIKVSNMEEFFQPDFHLQDTGTINEIGDAPTIVFDNVTVRGDDEVTILNNISLKIPGGKNTVIVGVSGSGKTTLMSLLLRFTKPNSGNILIDGKKLEQYSLHGLRNAITYSPQEIALFNDTILNNISFGDPDASTEEIQKAVRQAVADTFIDQFTESYRFRVGEGGANLSGGQRQRILLARTFLKSKAPIMILDEPISALDVKTRSTLFKNFTKIFAGKTVVIISNVLEFIDQADHVIVINEGMVLHEGSGVALHQQENLARILLRTS